MPPPSSYLRSRAYKTNLTSDSSNDHLAMWTSSYSPSRIRQWVRDGPQHKEDHLMEKDEHNWERREKPWTIAEEERVDLYSRGTEAVIEALGHAEALVTDLSQVVDFTLMY